jgi:hypothetical protein
VEQEGPRLGSEFETSSATQRLTLNTGDELGPPPTTIAGSATSWFHRIELSGDVDLTWDGGTIEVRPSAGTVTAGGQTAAIIDDATPRHTRLVLYVTPAWYAVMVYRIRSVSIFESASTRIGTTRSSIQQFDRDNTAASPGATLTAAADNVRVYRWTLADSTGDCDRPIPPMLTEDSHLLQTAGTKPTAQSTGTYPETFDVTGSAISGRREYFCAGDQVDTFSGLVPVSPALLGLFGPTAWTWEDKIAGNFTESSGAVVGPSVQEQASLSWEPIGGCDCSGVDQCSFDGNSAFVPRVRVNWPLPTIADPYPKIRQEAIMDEDPARSGMSPSDTVRSFTTFGSNGRAAATTQLVIDRSIPSGIDGTEITEATVEWATR